MSLASGLAEEIEQRMTEARGRTLALFDLARERDLHESPGFGFRPVIWHLAHIGVFEAYWLLQKLRGEPTPDARYESIFDPIKTPRENSKDLPTRAEMEEYLARVRAQVLSRLEKTEFDGSDPLLAGGYIYRLVIEHEEQHQETLCYLLQLMDASKKKRTREASGAEAESLVANQSAVVRPGEMISVPTGAFVMGSVRGPFAYDNELPPHEVFVPAFRLDKCLTTNEEYAEFVAEGGYTRREFWSDEGWDWREREGWKNPLYWTQQTGVWRVKGMFEEEELAPLHPVTGVSWHEAEAYARFRGKRLPTEAEWERAASWDERGGVKRRYAWGDSEPTEELCNFGNRFWGTTPVGSFPEGASPSGCLDMTGNVWEWTATPFDGFPGFRPFPYPEYSATWFDGDHRVLKGGSWATLPSVLRISFRNFFRRQFRIAFAGIRCAADA